MKTESEGDLSRSPRNAKAFQVMLPADLIEQIKVEAKKNERSANREIVYALRQRYEVTA
jgi:hypothetical protein